ncbi:hypothetical protein M9H77_28529 [Catharanthus roseus]|uniref:Uncharacterized protein n=1 Tax=Catharanthus roseus TaxID=4058 RepID=A0ACC0AGL2_CATRO|nr:hypothetical protein M9H77_28529 [Catharanthus roseus]
MWVELICGLILFRLLKRYFYDDGDAELLDADSSSYSDATLLFTVSDRLQKLYGGKCHVGLNIPDADSASRLNIDMVLVTDREAVVVSVINIPGIVSINEKDGTWVCTATNSSGHHKHKSEQQCLPDPVAEVKQKVSVLESYLEQRGLALPEGYLSYKVICPNPHFGGGYSTSFPSEVITYDQWTQLKPEHKNMLSGWIKGAFRSGKKEMQESFHEQLNSILSTAPMLDRSKITHIVILASPMSDLEKKEEVGLKEVNGCRYYCLKNNILKFKFLNNLQEVLQQVLTRTMDCWVHGGFSNVALCNKILIPLLVSLILRMKLIELYCRIELKGDKFLLGDFLEFKGKQDDIQALRNVKRSKVSRLVIQKTSMLGLAHSKLQVLYSPRDYRSEGASASEWKEVSVRSSTEVLFQLRNSSKVRKYKLSSVVGITLSA